MKTEAVLGDLPVWDLSDLYASPDAPTVKADFEASAKDAEAFAQKYQGKLASLTGAELGAAIAAYEKIDEVLSRIGSFAQLVYARNMVDSDATRFYQSTQERITEIATKLLFFGLELNRLDDAVLAEQLKDPAANHYRAWIDASRSMRPHQLPDEQEQLLMEKQVAGRAAWVRLFDETMADLRVEYRGEELTVAQTLNLLVDRDRGIRQDAAQAFGKALGGDMRTFGLITNTLAKDKEIEDRWRKFAKPISARNLGNRVEDEVVGALISAVRDSYVDLSHRYYKLKAKWLSVEVLDYWDRNAPLPWASDKSVPWADARTIVLDAFGGFSPKLAAIGQEFFDKPWIDAGLRPGKSPGAFAHPTVPSAHPYLLVNYQGKVRDVMTLAHELGHGVHQVLAGKAQGHLLADTPLTLAETASVFGEMLTFQALLKAESDPTRRRALLAGKVEDMLNTVVRQIAMHSFEEQVHDRRRQGELSAEELGDIWIETQTASLGPALRFDEHYRNYWAYIPHFIHSPFYVYAYAFGDCLVNSLYAVYQGAEAGFAERYLTLLSAGGSKRYDELLKPFGLDARDPTFWKQGLGVLRGFIDQLEAEG